MPVRLLKLHRSLLVVKKDTQKNARNWKIFTVEYFTARLTFVTIKLAPDLATLIKANNRKICISPFIVNCKKNQRSRKHEIAQSRKEAFEDRISC